MRIAWQQRARADQARALFSADEHVRHPPRMKDIPVRGMRARSAVQLSDHFSIRTIEGTTAGTDMVQPLHRHDHYFLLVLTQGSGIHTCDFRTHALRPHSMYVMRPRQVHSLHLKAGATGYFIQFNADFLATQEQGAQRILRRAGHMEAVHLAPERYQELLVLLHRIARECAAGREGHLHIVRAYLNAFLAELTLGVSAPAVGSGTKRHAEERLDELLELIEMHVRDTKEVRAYAERMHLSTFQLNAIAKAGTGRTCSELITDQLILEAKRYLLATSDQVNQVADRLGYDDVSYFIRFFKKHTGRTPEAFRRQAR